MPKRKEITTEIANKSKNPMIDESAVFVLNIFFARWKIIIMKYITKKIATIDKIITPTVFAVVKAGKALTLVIKAGFESMF